MEGFRKWELHGPKEAGFPSEACFHGEAVISLVADERIRQLFNTRGHAEKVNDIDSMSSGSMSPDLGDIWRQWHPVSPKWEGELELGFDEDISDNAGERGDDEGLKDHLSETSESPLWVSILDFLTLLDVLVMRTAGPRWNHAKQYGSCAALWFFLLEKDESEKGASQNDLVCVVITVNFTCAPGTA